MKTLKMMVTRIVMKKSRSSDCAQIQAHLLHSVSLSSDDTHDMLSLSSDNNEKQETENEGSGNPDDIEGKEITVGMLDDLKSIPEPNSVSSCEKVMEWLEACSNNFEPLDVE